jgi:hypothetical protein
MFFLKDFQENGNWQRERRGIGATFLLNVLMVKGEFLLRDFFDIDSIDIF